MLVWVFTHWPPQSVKPELQEIPQAPPLHVALPFVGIRHALPHSPQLSASEDVLRHMPPQSWKPVSQTTPQTPSTQLGSPFVGSGQPEPQPPQFAGSDDVSTH